MITKGSRVEIPIDPAIPATKGKSYFAINCSTIVKPAIIKSLLNDICKNIKVKRIIKARYIISRLSFLEIIYVDTLVKIKNILKNYLHAKIKQLKRVRNLQLEERPAIELGKIKVMSLNINNYLHKGPELDCILNAYKPEIICLQETGRKAGQKNLFINGYTKMGFGGAFEKIENRETASKEANKPHSGYDEAMGSCKTPSTLEIMVGASLSRDLISKTHSCKQKHEKNFNFSEIINKIPQGSCCYSAKIMAAKQKGFLSSKRENIFSKNKSKIKFCKKFYKLNLKRIYSDNPKVNTNFYFLFQNKDIIFENSKKTIKLVRKRRGEPFKNYV